MGDNSKIEWTDASWNCVTGCTKVSSGCDHCYAETFAERWRGTAGHHFEQGFDVRLWPDRLDLPLRWRRPRRVFVNSMSDVFHEAVPDDFIARMFAVMAATPQHTYQLLTKRHGRMRSLLNSKLWWQYEFAAACRKIGTDYATSAQWRQDDTAFLPNVWLGVSTEDQKWASIRVPALLETPAMVRFLSCEPLLGPIDLRDCGGIDAIERDWIGGPPPIPGTGAPHPLIDWIIVGGESGFGARRCELGWIEDILNACHQAEVPIFIKQLGSVLGREFHAGAKGGDMERWPAYLQHRHFPRTAEVVPQHDLEPAP